jgi:hypothetical protein
MSLSLSHPSHPSFTQHNLFEVRHPKKKKRETEIKSHNNTCAHMHNDTIKIRRPKRGERELCACLRGWLSFFVVSWRHPLKEGTAKRKGNTGGQRRPHIKQRKVTAGAIRRVGTIDLYTRTRFLYTARWRRSNPLHLVTYATLQITAAGGRRKREREERSKRGGLAVGNTQTLLSFLFPRAPHSPTSRFLLPISTLFSFFARPNPSPFFLS